MKNDLEIVEYAGRILVCAPLRISEFQIMEHLNSIMPTETAHGWFLSEKQNLLKSMRNNNPYVCFADAGRQHYLYEC